MKKILIFLVSLLFTFTIMNVNGQDTCSKAAVIDSIFGSMSKWTTISVNSSNVCWSTFTSNSFTNNLNIYSGESNTVLITSIILYHGNCNSLILDSTYNVNDTIYSIQFNNLSLGLNYYLKIIFNNSFTDEILLTTYIPTFVTNCNNYPISCGSIKNRSFEYVLSGWGPNYPPGAYNGYYAFQNNDVCDWNRGLGQPSLPFENHYGDYQARLYTTNSKVQAIYQTGLSLTPGNYTVSMRYWDDFPNSGINKINIVLTDFNIAGVTLSGNSVDDIPYYGTVLLDNDIQNHNKNINTLPTVYPNTFPYRTYPYFNDLHLYEDNQSFSISNTDQFNEIIIFPKGSSSSYNMSLTLDDIQITPRITTFNYANPLYLGCPGSPVNSGDPITITATLPTGSSNSNNWIISTVRNPESTSHSCTPLPCGWLDFTNTGSNSFSYTTTVPSITTTYYFEAIDNISPNYGSSPCRYYGSFTIIPGSPAVQTITISGGLYNDCSLLGIFSVPYQNDVTYSWTIPTGVSYYYTSTYGSSQDILNITDWGNVGIQTIYVEGYANGCLVYQGQTDVNPGINCNGYMHAGYIISSYYGNNYASIFDGSLFGSAGSTPSGFSTSAFIYFDGTVYIDQPLYLNSCPNIFMGPNAKIILWSGATLKITNSHIQGCCAWDGIWNQTMFANGTNIILDNDIIQDAKNAVVSENGGSFDITNTLFVNNKIGIKVFNNTLPLGYPDPGIITLNTFEWDQPGYGGFFSGDNHLTGIDVDNSLLTLTIGDNFNPSNQNLFKDIQYGIKINNSDAINIYNNYFDNIGITSLNPPSYSGTYQMPDEAAIFTSASVLQYYQTTIGDMGITRNYFNNCNIGVFAHNVIMNSIFNRFDNQHFTAIHLKDCAFGNNLFKNEIFMNPAFSLSNPSIFNSAIFPCPSGRRRWRWPRRADRRQFRR